MANTGSIIFSSQAREKLRSPDDLDKYVRVTRPSTWAVLLAFVLLLAGVLCWGVFGTVSTSVTGTGVVIDGVALCYLPSDEAARLHVGDASLVGGRKLKVADVARLPSSRAEAQAVLGSDYLTDTLLDGDWATKVTFGGDVSRLDEGVPLSVNVTCEHVAPITLVLGE